MAYEEKPPQKVKEVFRFHWLIFKSLGPVPHPKYPKLYKVYAILLHICANIIYPLHLVLGLFYLVKFEDVLRNVTISVPSIVGTVKFFNIWRNLKKVQHLEEMLDTLGGRINHPNDRRYYRKVPIQRAAKVLHLFYFICGGVALTSEVTVLIMGIASDRRLMYPAYFPFDPHASTGNYLLAHLFQCFGLLVALPQNLVNDTYGAMCLALLAGHATLLGKRVASIGYDGKKSCEENNRELMNCIADHNLLFDCHRKINEIIGLGMFAQVISASLIMGMAIIYIVFYVDNIVECVYYGFVLFGSAMELFPTCYYGTYFEYEFDQLTRMLFACNWMDQDRAFKKKLIICVEQSLKKRTFYVGGMFPINLDTFFATCKGAYSLLALALNMK